MKTRGRPDFLLIVLTFILVGIGLVMVYSSSSIFSLINENNDKYYLQKQIMWVGISIIGMFTMMNIPYTFFKKHFVKILLFALLLLVAVLIPGIGQKINGARSWIIIGPASLQPAEFAKLALIIYLAALISKKGEKFRDFKKGLLPTMIVPFVFFLLIALQSDLGSGMILLATSFMLLYAAGANLKHLGTIALGFAVLIFSFIITSSYRIQRFLNFADPWNDGLGGLGTGYQLVHSYFAIAHGGWTGAGFGKSIEKYLYLPEAQTDFIFAIFSEEMGFFAVLFFLLFYIFFLWRILIVTFRAKDLFAKLIGVGIVSMIFIQAFFNIGGVIGLIPLTGVPLPFISYGGSSLLLNFLSMGIVLSISREYSKQKIQKMINETKAITHP